MVIAVADRLDTEAAARKVDQLDEFARRLMHERVMAHPYFQEFQAGTLPIETVRQFFRYFYTFALEVNTALGTLYHRFVPFLKEHPDFEDIITEKIADEFGHPTKGGHIRTLERTAASLGLTKQELVYTEIPPGARAYTDFIVRVTTEGTLAEYFAISLFEGNTGYWSGAAAKTLLAHYITTGRQEDEPFMSVHAEADMQEHEGGMGHGDQAKYALQRLYEMGEAKYRPGFTPEYLMYMLAEFFSLMEDDLYHGRDPDRALRALGLR